MKSARWLVAGSVVFCGLATGSNLWFWFGPEAWSARLTCRKARANLDSISTERYAEHVFVLENTGGKEVVVHEIVRGCGCVTAPIERLVIPVGEAVDFPVRIDLKGLEGPFEKGVVLKSNTPNQPNLRLTLTGVAAFEKGRP